MFVEVVEETDVATPEEVGALELFFGGGVGGGGRRGVGSGVGACVCFRECNS